ncbi:MAG TPA: L-aspartate oxidase [Candidatus Aquicultor sp.]|jgi:L-aspartate oxidase
MVPRYLVNFDTDSIGHIVTDVIVIGSGVAGLSAALELSKEYDVALIAKDELKESATWYAQGGVATAISSDDSPKLHLKDTLEAGAGLCDREAVDILVTEAADRIGELIRLGTKFDWKGNRIRLSREGGHRLARVLHSGDATGSEIESSLIHVVEAWKSIQIFDHRFALDLFVEEGRCTGVLCMDERTGELVVHEAKAIIIASGGAGQLYSVTTSPHVLTGDGIAMAYRAGATLVDMEFMQFHPTALAHDIMPRFLITEALRGEGAYLRDCNGERFMLGKHPLAELAPRYIVTGEIFRVMQRCGRDHVDLDATHIPEETLREHFHTIYTTCAEYGIDITKEYIPVCPVAHYTIGGIRTDLNGCTSIPGLYATGEAACTGVHGANRLASNSLLEGLVFSKRIADELHRWLDLMKDKAIALTPVHYNIDRSEIAVDIEGERTWLQKLMMDQVGIVRSASSLQHALNELGTKGDVVAAAFSTRKGFELQNLLSIAPLIAGPALVREETRGVHYREDFPEARKEWQKHIEQRITEDIVAV